MTFTESRYALIIPALDEADSIGKLLQQIPREMFCQVIVVDNGSQDSTADVARNAGAQVVQESGRGYGQACLTGLASLSREATAIVFMDGDLSDDPAILPRLLQFFEEGRWDLVIGSRTLGCSEAGSLTPLQRFGNWLATRLIRWIWDVSFTDLGMPRVVGREALNRLKLRDRGFGWNVEMQAKAARLHLRVAEVPIAYRRRRYGKSKISGTVSGSIRAGLRILSTIYRCWSNPPDE